MNHRLLFILGLILSLPIWTACSSAESTPEAIPTSSEISASPSPDNAVIVPELSQSYTGENELVNAVLTVQYPAGWTEQGTGTQLLLASTDPESIDSDQNALVITIMPMTTELLQDLAEPSAESLVRQAIMESTAQTVEVMTDEINGQAIAYAKAEVEGNATLVYAMQINDSVYIIVNAIKAQAFTEADEAVVTAIVESISYDEGEIPQSDG